MNLSRTILDGIVLSILFNAVVGLFFFVVPQAYAMMFPNGIKEAAKPYVTRKELRVMHLVLYPMYLLMFLYMAVSAHLAGVSGFWNLFWTGYIEMMFSDASMSRTRDSSRVLRIIRAGNGRNGKNSQYLNTASSGHSYFVR